MITSDYAGSYITLYISLNKSRHLANEGLFNITGDTGRELRSASTSRQKLITTVTLLPHAPVAD